MPVEYRSMRFMLAFLFGDAFAQMLIQWTPLGPILALCAGIVTGSYVWWRFRVFSNDHLPISTTQGRG